MAAYARGAKDSELIQYATEIKVRAERRCGELLTRSAETGDRATREMHGRGGQVASFDQTPPTLAQMGLTKDESSRYQQLAAMPAATYGAHSTWAWPGLPPVAALPWSQARQAARVHRHCQAHASKTRNHRPAWLGPLGNWASGSARRCPRKASARSRCRSSMGLLRLALSEGAWPSWWPGGGSQSAPHPPGGHRLGDTQTGGLPVFGPCISVYR